MLPKPVDRILVAYRAETLLAQFKDRDCFSVSSEEQQELRNSLRQLVTEEPGLSMIEAGVLLQIMLDELIGFSILGPYLRDENISRIQVFKNYSMIVYEQSTPQKCLERFRDKEHLTCIVNRLIQPDELDQYEKCELKLKDGVTVKVSLEPENSDAPVLEILR